MQTTLLTSARPGTQPVFLHFTSENLPGLTIAYGLPEVVLVSQPVCGCDACDDGSDPLLEAIDEALESVLLGEVLIEHEKRSVRVVTRNWRVRRHPTWKTTRPGSSGDGAAVRGWTDVTHWVRECGGCSDTIDAIDRHVERFIGPVETVQHEIVSDLIHVDIHVVPATADRPFHALVTSGMSDRPMRIPDELRGEVPEFAELMILLPPDWPLDQDDWKEERHYWPIRQLKILARLPHEYDTWLGAWHSMPNGDPAQPFAHDTDICAVMLAPPIRFPDEFRTIRADDGREIGLFAVLPLLPDEIEAKVRLGVDALLDAFEKHDTTQLSPPPQLIRHLSKQTCAYRYPNLGIQWWA